MSTQGDQHQINGDPSIELALDLAAPQATDRALDYGAAVGALAFMLAPKVTSVRAVDDRPEVVDEGKRLAVEVGTGDIDFAVVDLYGLPFADESFDLVVSRNSFHRFREPLAALREMMRVVAPGGRIVLCDIVVNREIDRYINELAGLSNPAHRRHDSRAEYLAFFEDAGLTVSDEQHARQTVDLDYWLEAGSVHERSGMVRTRLQEFPVKAQAALDVVVADQMVSFGFEIIGFRLSR